MKTKQVIYQILQIKSSVRVKQPCAILCLVAQSCLTLCGPMDCSPPDFSVPGDSSGKNAGVDFHALLQANRLGYKLKM